MSYNCIIVGNFLHVKNNNKIYPTKNGAYMNIVERIRDLCTQNKTTIKWQYKKLGGKQTISRKSSTCITKV